MYNQTNSIILIVDDNPTNLAVLSEALTEVGFEIAIATSGENAIKQSTYDPPDLILLDVMMAGIDGFETCHKLKQNPLTHDIPVIFMTALNDTADKMKGFNLGAVDYITKPFQQEEVLARVDLHLKLKNLTKQLEGKNIQLKQFAKDLEQRVTERTAQLSQSLHDLQEAQIQLVKSEKMSTLGQLLAGVAHEINNPLTSILCNVDNAEEYVFDLLEHLELYHKYHPNTIPEIAINARKIDLEFLIEDLPKIIYSLKLSSDSIHNISTSLRTFSRADQSYQALADIHEGIDSTLMILGHRLKANETRPAIIVIKEYDNIPQIKCYLGQLNQVFMNLFANAIDALDESNDGRSYREIERFPNIITIKTEMSDDSQSVVIKIKDNAKGMSEEVRKHIFDNLFTTKSAGKGTGLGLCISQEIVVDKHGGSLICNSVLGEGTELVICIPTQID